MDNLSSDTDVEQEDSRDEDANDQPENQSLHCADRKLRSNTQYSLQAKVKHPAT